MAKKPAKPAAKPKGLVANLKGLPYGRETPPAGSMLKKPKAPKNDRS